MRLAALAAAVALAGCSTYTGQRYAASADNVVALRAYHGVAVGDFAAAEPGKSAITCRAVGPVRTPDGEAFSDYVRKALVDELRLAGAYEAGGPIVLTGNLEAVDFRSHGVMVGTAPTSAAIPETAPPRWIFALTVTSSNGRKLAVSEEYAFPENSPASSACIQTAQAMMPAVQNLLRSLVRSANFADLVSPQ
jgi:hypothetical protein